MASRPSMAARPSYGFWCSKYSAVPEEAAVVRQIFADYLDGMGYVRIAKKLNASKIPTVTGSTWAPTTILNIINNRIYAGTATHEAIITPSTFEAAQAETVRRREERESRHIFTGLMKCGYCDAVYVRRGSGYGMPCYKFVWTCHTFSRTKKITCPGEQVPEGYLISKVAEVLEITESDMITLRNKIVAITLKGRNRRLFLQVKLKNGRVFKLSDRFPRTYNRLKNASKPPHN